MNSFSVVVLICSLSTPGPDCTADNAVDVVRGPASANASTCGMHAQAMLAPTAVRPGEGQYMKVVCVRKAAPVVADLRPSGD